MTQEGHVLEVERRLDLRQPVDRRRGVGERRRPAAALPAAHPAVFDVPDREAAAGEVAADAPHQQLAVARRPRPAMDRHHHRVRPAAARQDELSALAAVLGAVAVAAPGGDDIE
jgi:hypothetical protein